MLRDSSKSGVEPGKDDSRNLLKLKRPSRRQPPKSFGRPLAVVATALAVFIASQFLASLLIYGFLELTNSPAGFEDLSQSTLTQFSYILLAEILAVSLVLKIVKMRGLSLAAIGLGRRIKLSDISKALLGFGAFYVILIIVGLILTVVAPEFRTDQPQDIGFDNLSGYLDQILVFVALVFFPPVAEEILARGYLYSGLRSKWSFAPAMLLTSFIFAAAHLPGSKGLVWGAAINTFVLSVVLVYLREKTGALYACVILHAMNNAVAFGVHFHGSML